MVPLLAWALPAGAQEREIGVTSAVNPQAVGTPPVSPPRPLVVGANVVHEERVATDQLGRAHMQLLDGSALTVGENSDVVLDTFVYDPDSGTGELAFAATKGLFRLVGGKISKKNPVTFKTPASTIGIRGGIVIIRIFEDGRVSVTFLFGEELTVTNDEGTVTLLRPGFTVEIPGPGFPPGDPFVTPAELLALALDGLEAIQRGEGETRDAYEPAQVEKAAVQVVLTGSDLSPCDVIECRDRLPRKSDWRDGFVDQASQNQQAGSVGLVLTVGSATVTEGGSFALPVSLSEAVPTDLSFTFETVSGSAVKGGGGVAQNDFGTTGTVTIPAGQTTASIPITTIDDGVFEGTETFFVNVVSNFPSLATFAAPQALITIIDDEPQPTLGVADLTVTETTTGTSTVDFTVTLSGPADKDVTVAFTTRAGSALSGGSGPGETDFVPTSGTVTIPAGQTTATVSVTLNGDTVAIEGTENFFLDLSSPTGPATIATATGEAKIINNTTGATLLSGRAKRDVDAAAGTDDNSATDNVGLNQVFVAGGFLQASIGTGIYFLPFPTTKGATTAFASGTTPFGTVSGSAFLSASGDFVFYELDPAGSRQFLFAGVPTTVVPTTGRNRYALKSDFGLDSDIPFIPNALGGSLTPGAATHAYIDWDTSGGGVQRPFGGGVVVISGTVNATTGAVTSQKSATSIFTGQVLIDGSGKPHIQGEMRGHSRTAFTGRANFFESDVSSSDAGDGSDFFGSGPDHFVLEASTVSATDTLLARTGVEHTVNGTTTTGIFPNVPAVDDPPPLGTATTRTLTGFVGGMIQETSGGTLNAVNPIQNNAGNAVTITASAALNTVDATFAFEAVADNDKYSLVFGDSATTGRSFFFDNDTFGAIERTASF
jgi:hypothetical protein